MNKRSSFKQLLISPAKPAIFFTAVMMLFLICAALPALSFQPPVLSADPDPRISMDLRNFRTMADELKKRGDAPLPSREGLSELKVSGSSQFSAEGLRMIKDRLAGRKIIIVDLREESHGFINGVPVSWRGIHNWANMGKSLAEIESDETERLQNAKKAGSVKIAWEVEKEGSESYREEAVAVKDVMTEKELCRSMGVQYIRIPVSDHLLASDPRIDYFIGWYRSLPDDIWLHFHCKAGKGRTTTFITLCDMMRNASRVSCDDIVRRQLLLGGTNLFSEEKPDSWKYAPMRMRALFAVRFHQYCRENRDGFRSLWSAFRAGQDRL